LSDLLTDIFGEAISAERRLVIFTMPDKRTQLFDGLTAVDGYCRQASDQGREVYFGLGLVRGTPKGRGEATDMAAIGALWADIDLAGPAHPGKALPANIDEVEGLLAELPLAPSVVVDSGHGVHPYWLLKEPWVFENEADRRRAATFSHSWHGLVCRMAERRGWKLENLGGLARVLRVPGTVNHKLPDQPAPVRILRYDATLRYNLDDFEPFVAAEDELAETTGPTSVGNLVLRPDAAPPAGRMIDASAVSWKFVETWQRKRADFSDQSQSAYDLSLATIAAALGWADQEIANLIIAARREHNEKPEKALRPDYMLRTLARAREAASAMPAESGDVDISSIARQAVSATANPPPPDDGFELVLEGRTLRELMARHEGLNRPVIHGLLREGETMNVIASPKVGKSWLVSNLAIAISSGRDWLGFGVEQGRVLHIDNELHEKTSIDRYERIIGEMGLPPEVFDRNITVISLRGKLQNLHALCRSMEKIKPGTFKLVIIDAFYRTLPEATDENDNGAIANLYNLIDHCAEKLKCAFVLVHHSSKGNQAGKSVTDVGAGAGSQSRAADTHLVVRQHQEPGTFIMEAAVRSWPPMEPLGLRFQWPLFTLAHEVDTSALLGALAPKAPKASDVPLEEFVEQCVAINDPCSQLSVKHEGRQRFGLSDRKAEDTLDLAIERGLVARIRTGAQFRYVKVRPGLSGDKALWTGALLAHDPAGNAQKIAETVGATRQYVNQVRRQIDGNSVETDGN